jgi:glycerol-3-phosphate acyltransferase PlsY
VLGKLPGSATFFLDFLKGVLPVLLAKKFLSGTVPAAPLICGCIAVAGHIWSPFIGFKGGKGVATGFGAFVGLAPEAALCSAVIFLIFSVATGHVAVGSMAAALSLPVFLFLFREPAYMLAVSALMAVIIIWRHKSNIKKLIKRQED